MRSHSVLNPALGVVLLLATAVVTAQNLASILVDDRGSDVGGPLRATVVATGIPGAGAIAQVGTFHKGGPFAPGGALAGASHPVLDRTRLLVASTSNFGAPVARPLEAPGSILSRATSHGPIGRHRRLLPVNRTPSKGHSFSIRPRVPRF